MAGGGFNPDWIPAAITAGGVGLAVTRQVYRARTRRLARYKRGDLLAEAVWGRAAERNPITGLDDPAQPGLEKRTGALETWRNECDDATARR